MKPIFNKLLSILWAGLLLAFFEAFLYLASGGTIANYSYSSGQEVFVIIANLVVFLSFFAVMTFAHNFERRGLLEMIPLLILDLGVLTFIFYNPSASLCHAVIVASVIVLFLVSLEAPRSLEKKDNASSLPITASVFTSFVWYLNAYTVFYAIDVPYWAIAIALALITSMSAVFILWKSRVPSLYAAVLAVLYVLVLTEFFLFSFFWPIESILLKSLLLSLTYYLYWGSVVRSIKGHVSKRGTAVYLAVFVLTLLGLLALFIIKGK